MPDSPRPSWAAPPPICALPDALESLVQPGMHLHFASTPSRSNAAILGVAHRFQGTRPRFTLSSTGFHSTAHLLGLLRLGQRYIASFFGDNYPTPRPNLLYTRLRDEGAALEIWSLGTLVEALRAGALGLPGALTRSLVGSTLGDDLAAAGRLDWLPDEPDAALLRPLRPDLTFLHALAADPDGNVLLAGPRSEGLWSALGAREGIIVTADHLISGSLAAAHPEAVALPRHRIRAICHAPGGARPQPQPSLPAAGLAGYPDETDTYGLWRRMCSDAGLWADFQAEVLRQPDPQDAMTRFVARRKRTPRPAPVPPEAPPHSPAVARLALAARWIAARVREEGYPVILAGIGQSFLACRMAAQQLAVEGRPVTLMVETGLYDLPAEGGDPFLLSYQNLSSARRLSSVEDVLMALTCGADSRCLGVIGAGEVDPSGNLNSTLSQGSLLVGSGGANDIASSAAEVIVLTAFRPDRLVSAVEHITSPGRRVRSVVTERGVLCRSDARLTDWRLEQPWPVRPDLTPAAALAEARAVGCAWSVLPGTPEQVAAPLSSTEWAQICALDPGGFHWNTSETTWWSPSQSPASGAISRRAS